MQAFTRGSIKVVVGMMAGQSAESGPELMLEGVTKLFGGFKAVDNVSLSIGRGEFITILGASGSGKTTTLMMIAGFDFPSAGRVVFRGRDITYMPPHLRNMGMVFQNYALFPHLSVTDNIAFPLKVRRVKSREARERVAAAIDLVRLGEHAHKLPSQLSGGQQQRVALARALVFGPSLLLMDEPLGALDKSLREQMQLEIKRVQEATGVTIMSVTHDQDEALAMSDRIVVMERGRVETMATPLDIYQRPKSRMVAEFMKETNILEAKVGSGGDGRVRLVVADGFELDVPATDQVAGCDSVLVCLRPERIRLTPGLGTTAGHPGRVTDVIYLGDVIKYHVCLDRTPSAIELCVKTLASSAADVIERGAPVTLAWPADGIQILRR